MKWAAWSELPRAMVSSEVGAFMRSSAPKSAYAASSFASWRETAEGASSASASMRVPNGGSFHEDVGELQVAVEHHDVAPRARHEAPAIGHAEVVGREGRHAPRRIGEVQSQLDDEVAQRLVHRE